jgi:hypothetical protein
MIFSCGKSTAPIAVKGLENFDLICFFQTPHSIAAPLDSWFDAVCASLRNKRNVLILEENINQLPSPKANQRWQIGEGWVCLEPRALNAITAAYPKNSQNIVLFRSFLSTI